MKRLGIATVVATLLSCNSAFSPAFSQVGGMGSPMPGIAATSPLGMVPGASVPPTGIPLGATELASPGLSPLTDGTAGMTGVGTTCLAIGGPSSGISGASTYDGGGMATSLPGSGVICDVNPSGSASSTAAMSSTASGNMARTGIPFGSVEIGNAGVSPLVVVPTPSASPSMMGTLGPSPSTTIGTSTTPSMLGAQTMPSVTGTAGLSTNQTAMPCGTIVTGGPAMNC
jgi:hypothetical protein